MVHHYEIKSEELQLRPLTEGDIESLRCWRNDPAMTKYLTKLPYITPQMQAAWFQRYQEDESEITLAIDCIAGGMSEFIGTVSLSAVGENRVECGRLMIGHTGYKGRGFGRKSIALCLSIAFDQMGVEACEAHANPENAPSFVSFVNEGFQIRGSRPFGNDGFEYGLELTQERYRLLNRRNDHAQHE